MAEPLRNASVAAARARMLDNIAPLGAAEAVALEDAFARILAEDVIAARDQPPFAASAMDGYALNSADSPGALTLIGEAAAGAGLARALESGECARIFTGAPMPEGADCVAIQEDVRREGDIAHIPATPIGQHVRPRSVDFKAGDLLLRRGARLDGVALALAAARGEAALKVARAPRVMLLATGDEIVPPGMPAGPHQIFESVSFGLGGLIRAWGGAPKRLAPRGDSIAAIAEAARDGFAWGDLLITIGGASVGDHDLVKPALATLGLELIVERAAMRPGKPVWFGRVAGKPVLGLPGNPASALACAYVFLEPILAAMQGAESRFALQPAILGGRVSKNGPREHYVRARLSVDEAGRQIATPFEAQDSSLLSVFRDADALIRLAPDTPALDAGARIDILRLGR